MQPCPACQRRLKAELPAGLTTVCCNACGAQPLHVPMPPPKEARARGRKSASHHAPPLNPARAGRAPTAWNLYLREQTAVLRAELPVHTNNAAVWPLAAKNWPSVREAYAAAAALARPTGAAADEAPPQECEAADAADAGPPRESPERPRRPRQRQRREDAPPLEPSSPEEAPPSSGAQAARSARRADKAARARVRAPRNTRAPRRLGMEESDGMFD